MEFSVLGPLEVIHEDALVTIGGVRQRALLAMLVLNAGTRLTTDNLARALWDGDEPPAAHKILRNGMSRLRKTLGERGADLRTERQGYVLSVPTSAIDASRHHDLVATARRDFANRDWESANRRLGAALALWRGYPLADLAEAGFAWPQLAALRESWWQAVEDCAIAEIMAGRDRDLLGELAVRSEAEPTRERLCGLRMLALYRNGRPADALDVYRSTRVALAGGFPTDLGEPLRRLAQDILARRPELAERDAVLRFV